MYNNLSTDCKPILQVVGILYIVYTKFLVMFRVRSLVAPLSLLLHLHEPDVFFAQNVPVVVEIHADGNPVSLNMSQVRSNDSTHTYHAGDTLNSFNERWAVYSKTENLESGDTLDYELNRVPNITTTGTINHNTVTNGNLLGHR